MAKWNVINFDVLRYKLAYFEARVLFLKAATFERIKKLIINFEIILNANVPKWKC